MYIFFTKYSSSLTRWFLVILAVLYFIIPFAIGGVLLSVSLAALIPNRVVLST